MSVSINQLPFGGSQAASQSVAVGADGTIVAAFQGYGATNYSLSAGYGIMSGPNEFRFYGTDLDFDTGDVPSVAIDPNGMAVSVHETNAVYSSTIMVNIGTARGGQGNLSEFKSVSTNMSGGYPSIVAIGAGQFVVSAIGPTDELSPLRLWLVSVNGSTVMSSPITIVGNWPSGGPSCSQYPQLAYYNGMLAVSGGLTGSLCWNLGTLSGTTFTPVCAWTMPGNNSVDLGAAVALGPNNTIYSACLKAVGMEEWDIEYWAGTYTLSSTGPSATLQWTTQSSFGINNALGVSLASLSIGGFNTVVAAYLLDGAGANVLEVVTVSS